MGYGSSIPSYFLCVKLFVCVISWCLSAFWVSRLINELPWHLCRLFSSELIIGTFQMRIVKCSGESGRVIFFKFFYKQGHLGCLLASFPHSFFSFPPLIFEGLLKEWHVTKSRGAFSASSEQDCILSSQSMNSCVDLSRNRVTMCGETPMPENSSVTPEPTLSSHLWTAPAEVGWCLNMWVLVFHTMVLWGWWLPTQ